jgi:methyltransferase (TIGR00027 family)
MSSPSGETLPGVSRTAVWVAGMRADEGGRADRLFEDPLARAFVAAAASRGAVVPDATAVPPGASDFLAIRTRFFDDQALDACASGIRQVALLAAGLDGRAFRLDWPVGVRLFELDLPELFGFKEPVLAGEGAVARCERIVVPVDLRANWTGELRSAGFDPAATTGWLAEGLLPYLIGADRGRLVSAVTELSTPGSRLAFDYLDSAAGDHAAVRATSDAIRSMGAQLIPTVDSPENWLAEHGWQTRQYRVPALGESYGRPLPAHVDMAASNTTVLIAAAR